MNLEQTPPTVMMKDNIIKVNRVVYANKWLSIPELLANINVSAGSIHTIFHGNVLLESMCPLGAKATDRYA